MNVPAPRRQVPRGEQGFTLLEILVVIAILGLLVALVAPNVLRQLGGARISTTRLNIAGIASNLDLYKLDVGSYPSTEQGLQALIEKPGDAANWSGPYAQGGKLPVDAWNHPFSYRNPSNRADHPFDICSGGPNSVSGGSSAGDPSAQGAICNN